MPSEVQRMEKSTICEYVNNKACNKAVLLFGFADFCLMYIVNKHRLLTPQVTNTAGY